MFNKRARGRKRPSRALRSSAVTRHHEVEAPAAFDSGGSGHPSWAVAATVLTAFTVIFVGLAVNAYTQASAMWDEPIHLTAGYAAGLSGRSLTSSGVVRVISLGIGWLAFYYTAGL